MGEESGRTASLRALPTSDYEVPSDRNNASHTFSLLQDQVGTCSDFSIYPGIYDCPLTSAEFRDKRPLTVVKKLVDRVSVPLCPYKPLATLL